MCYSHQNFKSIYHLFSENLTRYYCQICKRFYKFPCSLRKHQSFECGQLPTHCCPNCDKKFPQKRSLVIHMAMIHKKMLPKNK